MILVIGGAYNGKTDFIKNKFGLSNEDFTAFDEVTNENIQEIKAVKELNKYIYNYLEALIKENENCCDEELFRKNIVELLNKNDDIIIELREVGAGIVPIDKVQRIYREMLGRISCEIAQKADEVYRIVCGIAIKLK